MSTQKQREANLRNTQLSSRPTTPTGKAASSHNSLKYGIFASDLTLLDNPETSGHIQSKLTEYCDYFQPANPIERDLIDEIAFLEVRKRRVARAETGLLNDARARLLETDAFQDTDGTLYARYDASLAEPARQRGIATMHLGAAWHQVGQTIDRMSRHEGRLSAQIDKKRRLLADLIASRPPAPVPQKGTVQNEPNFDLSPVPATPPTPVPAPVAAQNRDHQGAWPPGSDPKWGRSPTCPSARQRWLPPR